MKAGDAITIPPGPLYPHHLLNTSDAELKVLCISTHIKPKICEYPESAKSMAWAPGVKLVQRVGGGGSLGWGGLGHGLSQPAPQQVADLSRSTLSGRYPHITECYRRAHYLRVLPRTLVAPARVQGLAKRTQNRSSRLQTLRNPMTSKISWRLLKAAMLSLLAACSQSAPETIARLEVDSAGRFSLNGLPVPENRLVEELQALQQTSANLSLEILVPQNANHQVVSKAVVSAQIAKIAGIRFVAPPAK